MTKRAEAVRGWAMTLLMLCASAGSHAANRYSLSILEGEGLFSTGINNAGQVVGNFAPQHSEERYAVQWRGTTPQAVPGLESAWGINDAGTVVGTTWKADRTGFAPAIVVNGRLTQVAPDGDGAAINNRGDVAGYGRWEGVNSGFVWQPAALQRLSVQGYRYAGASALNDLGWAGGSVASRLGSPSRAVIWAEGTSRLLVGINGYTNTAVTGLNNSGLTIGQAWNEEAFEGRGALWDANGQPQLLALLDGHIWSEARDINEHGVIVGGGSNSDMGIAVMWHDGQVVDLNTLLNEQSAASGWTWLVATAVNDDGWVTGIARHESGLMRSYLLTPSVVPEPSAAVLWLFGLAGVAWRVKQRRARA